ncbi:DegV family protein [Halalkalibacterium halodurans]|uniref:DegV domain-containing protein BH3627 n=1 Tax=Halalkalibacterium halodurans (strain ATCC BAA-125 / DSM 18197 / FERM 7344 / JCM 9153 / C-125) TaxID=272558 RepID=Y3627_HALH5|nr:DegV family protein [Halalkalibacterium halodurans]Q9K6U8.1 RecName: Full=DegV domain-containing protein BH3627 [Halalkalibacterium halodurans C-125]MED4081938.1 DegV family protein [Halalkalibacterium halodurans]MED4083681.1 DegV family protein [Halalkalibacterium halodurans]MED4106417.1 DegV family protein [Halalkalibacterium halodurans]MED4107828.1 DegV family protein [Halalkalibacterium halodurans]MED4148758.1 DegV family protein [Halalkalibacterium halodurans]
MTKIAIVTDSTAYLGPKRAKELGVIVVPLSVVFGEEAYQEEVELSSADFYEKLKHEEKLPTTSQPAVGLFVETFERLAKEGFEVVISIHLSSKISGTYQSALTAGSMVEGIEVIGYDSGISCEPQANFVAEAAKLVKEGADPQTIIDHLDEVKKRTNALFVVHDLSHLHRGGRLNAAQLVVGSLLKIKPILHFEDGSIVPLEKVRTEKKAWARVKELFAEEASSASSVKATVIHANRLDGAEKLADEIRSQFSHVDVSISHFGPVIGTHLGEGSIGLSWYIEK